MTGVPMMTVGNKVVKQKKHACVREIKKPVKPELLETHFPGLQKSNRARNIVRRALAKSKTEAFTTKVDAVLNIVSQLYMIERLFEKHPNKLQRIGGHLQERREAYLRLIKAHDDLIALV